MEPPGKACSFSLISSWLKLWILELFLSSSLGGIITHVIYIIYGYKVICAVSVAKATTIVLIRCTNVCYCVLGIMLNIW